MAYIEGTKLILHGPNLQFHNTAALKYNSRNRCLCLQSEAKMGYSDILHSVGILVCGEVKSGEGLG